MRCMLITLYHYLPNDKERLCITQPSVRLERGKLTRKVDDYSNGQPMLDRGGGG